MKNKIFEKKIKLDKDNFLRLLNIENHRLDIIRNGIYSIKSGFVYVTNFQIDNDDAKYFSNLVTDLSNCLDKFIKQMNLQIERIDINEKK